MLFIRYFISLLDHHPSQTELFYSDISISSKFFFHSVIYSAQFFLFCLSVCIPNYPILCRSPYPADKRWLSQSSNAAGDVFNLPLMQEMVGGGVCGGHSLPTDMEHLACTLFIFYRWGSGVHQEVLTSQKCQSEKGWTSLIPLLTVPLSSPLFWWVTWLLLLTLFTFITNKIIEFRLTLIYSRIFQVPLPQLHYIAMITMTVSFIVTENAKIGQHVILWKSFQYGFEILSFKGSLDVRNWHWTRWPRSLYPLKLIPVVLYCVQA